MTNEERKKIVNRLAQERRDERLLHSTDKRWQLMDRLAYRKWIEINPYDHLRSYEEWDAYVFNSDIKKVLCDGFRDLTYEQLMAMVLAGKE